MHQHEKNQEAQVAEFKSQIASTLIARMLVRFLSSYVGEIDTKEELAAAIKGAVVIARRVAALTVTSVDDRLCDLLEAATNNPALLDVIWAIYSTIIVPSPTKFSSRSSLETEVIAFAKGK